MIGEDIDGLSGTLMDRVLGLRSVFKRLAPLEQKLFRGFVKEGIKSFWT